MYIERSLEQTFVKLTKTYPIVAVVGARQAGKTTFLKEHAKKIKASYLLFDDPDVRNLFEEDVKKFEKQYIEGFDVALLDEVQYCKDAGRNLKYLADSGRRLWLTASSEAILSRDVLSYLVGRVSVLRLYPFSISEFLNARNQKAITQQMMDRNVWEHLLFGGYPKVVLTEDIELKKTILGDLYDTMVLKDVSRTFSIEDINSLQEFTKYLALNIGNLLSYENICQNLSLSFQTVKKYLNAMEKSHLIMRVSPFFNNKTKELTKQPRIYFIDTGLRNIITKTFETVPDGKLFENYVFSELLKIGYVPKYWRTKSKAEVDFIIEKDGEVIPLEVKVTSFSSLEKSFHSFIETYKPRRALVVFYKGEPKNMGVGDCVVSFVHVSALHKALKR